MERGRRRRSGRRLWGRPMTLRIFVLREQHNLRSLFRSSCVGDKFDLALDARLIAAQVTCTSDGWKPIRYPSMAPE